MSGADPRGGLLAGWGLSNLVEGLIDHHLLRIHHVRLGPNELLWDLAFLALGPALLGGRAALIRSARQDMASRPMHGVDRRRTAGPAD